MSSHTGTCSHVADYRVTGSHKACYWHMSSYPWVLVDFVSLVQSQLFYLCIDTGNELAVRWGDRPNERGES